MEGFHYLEDLVIGSCVYACASFVFEKFKWSQE